MPRSGEGQRRGPAATLLQKRGAELELSITDLVLRDVPGVCTGRLGGKGAAKTIPSFIAVNRSTTQFVVFLKLGF